MGIKHLNKFLRENASSAIKIVSFTELFGKIIAIDISIYMHKYVAEDNLIESMYNMLATFRYYNIIPVFIFDGKPITEKKELLLKRREDRKEAIVEYDNLQNIIKNNENMNEEEKQEIISQMVNLKRSFVKINKTDIEFVKRLIISYGATYYHAPNEADELCAYLAIKGKVWATLSEDMDMFIYGCTNVFRYLSLLNHNVVCYNMNNILKCLGITQKEFREICIISGTDYNIINDENTHNLYTTLKLFKKYLKDRKKNNEDTICFYDWLLNNTSYIKNIEDIELLQKIYDIFDLSKNHTEMKSFDSIKIANTCILKEDLKEILKTDGFIFSNT
jgi:predicted transcriptional regulator